MKLQEQIVRIQSMMGVISEDRKIDTLDKYFDKFFDSFDLIKTETKLKQYDWVNGDGKKVFERNDWGTFWVYDCDVYSDLLIISKMMMLNHDEFESSLISYLNSKYIGEFGIKFPIKKIMDAVGCFDF
jgi:hypothetical protein